MQHVPNPDQAPEEPNKHGQAKIRLASHPEATPETLAKLADTGSPAVSERVAGNPQTSAETLVKLSEHEDPKVRTAVAENQHTPQETLKVLAVDQHPDVRYRLAENHNAPLEVLETLAADQNPYVVARAEDTLIDVKSIAQRADELLLAENFAEAEDLYRKLLIGLEHLLGPVHGEVADAKHKLAAALTGQGKTDEAIDYEEQAQKIQEVV